MLKILYKDKEYCILTHANVQLEMTAGYGNNNIHWQSGGVSAAEILAEIDPLIADKLVAVKFNAKVYPKNYFVTTDGELEALTIEDQQGYQICLNTVAFVVDKIMFESYPRYKRYQKTFNEHSCTLAYFNDEELTADDIKYLQDKAQEALKSNISWEIKILSEQESVQYYQRCGEWYLIQQILAQESDYPYKFLFWGEYGMQETMPICPECKIIGVVEIEQSHGFALDKKICILNLKIVFS